MDSESLLVWIWVKCVVSFLRFSALAVVVVYHVPTARPTVHIYHSIQSITINFSFSSDLSIVSCSDILAWPHLVSVTLFHDWILLIWRYTDVLIGFTSTVHISIPSSSSISLFLCCSLTLEYLGPGFLSFNFRSYTCPSLSLSDYISQGPLNWIMFSRALSYMPWFELIDAVWTPACWVARSCHD